MATTTVQNVLDFHRQEGEVFDMILPFTTWATSRHVVVLWMWLHNTGSQTLIDHIKNSDPMTVLRFVREAEAILQLLREDCPPPEYRASGDDIPCTARMATRLINLHFFYANRGDVVRGMVLFLDGATRLVFNDGLRAAARAVAAGEAAVVPLEAKYMLSRPYLGPEYATEDRRTMLVTFINGHFIGSEELKEYFQGRWGQCVERLTMWSGQVPSNAWVVFLSPSLLPLVLPSTQNVEFNIRGKLFWARTYIPPPNYPSW